MFRERVLGDVCEESAVTGSPPFVAYALDQRDGADVIRAPQGDGDRSLQIAHEVSGSAPKLTQQQLPKRKSRPRSFRTDDYNGEDGALPGDEDVHRVAEGVRVQKHITGPEPAGLRYEGSVGWMCARGLSSCDSDDTAAGPLRHRRLQLSSRYSPVRRPPPRATALTTNTQLQM